MSLVEHLLSTRTPLEMAKMLKIEAEENAELRRRVLTLEVTAFWLKVDLEMFKPVRQYRMKRPRDKTWSDLEGVECVILKNKDLYLFRTIYIKQT